MGEEKDNENEEADMNRKDKGYYRNGKVSGRKRIESHTILKTMVIKMSYMQKPTLEKSWNIALKKSSLKSTFKAFSKSHQTYAVKIKHMRKPHTQSLKQQLKQS